MRARAAAVQKPTGPKPDSHHVPRSEIRRSTGTPPSQDIRTAPGCQATGLVHTRVSAVCEIKNCKADVDCDCVAPLGAMAGNHAVTDGLDLAREGHPEVLGNGHTKLLNPRTGFGDTARDSTPFPCAQRDARSAHPVARAYGANPCADKKDLCADNVGACDDGRHAGTDQTTTASDERAKCS